MFDLLLDCIVRVANKSFTLRISWRLRMNALLPGGRLQFAGRSCRRHPALSYLAMCQVVRQRSRFPTVEDRAKRCLWESRMIQLHSVFESDIHILRILIHTVSNPTEKKKLSICPCVCVPLQDVWLSLTFPVCATYVFPHPYKLREYRFCSYHRILQYT